MDRLVFEQLVSAWLDDRQDPRLRREIEAACVADPDCGRVVAEYEKLDLLMHAAADRPLAVNWTQFKETVSSEIGRTAGIGADAARVDRVLREALPSIESRVNWERYAQRISEALDQSGAAPRLLRVRWRPIAALASLAAAAAVVLWISLPSGKAPVAPSGRAPAIVANAPASIPEQLFEQPSPALAPAAPEVQSPTVAARNHRPENAAGPGAAPAIARVVQRGPVIIRVRVIEEPAPAMARASGRQAGQRSSEPEVFFMLEPPARNVLASAAGFSSY